MDGGQNDISTILLQRSGGYSRKSCGGRIGVEGHHYFTVQKSLLAFMASLFSSYRTNAAVLYKIAKSISLILQASIAP